MGTPLTNPKAIAEKGEAIYAQKYKEDYEAQYLGKYVAIEVTTETAYVDDSPEGALEKARKEHPDGLSHLIKVGAPGAFRVSYTSNADADWIFQ